MHNYYFKISSVNELIHELSAYAAGKCIIRSFPLGTACYRYGLKLPLPLAYGLNKCRALSTDPCRI